MEGAVRHLPVGRMLAVDDRGIGMRCTWHLDRGFVNLSLWRDDRCVETFHMTPGDAARVVSFLVTGMAEAVEAPAPASSASPLVAGGARSRWWLRLRRALAERLAA